MRKGVFFKTLAVLALAVLLGLGVFADSALPSLFWNDEGWYKDGIAPLIVRDGRHYVPADLFAMLESISVTAPRQDNLLLSNTATAFLCAGLPAVTDLSVRTSPKICAP